MCEFCTKYGGGEGNYWYLRAENYSYQLMDQLKTRETAIHLARKFNKLVGLGHATAKIINKLPMVLKNLTLQQQEKWQKMLHFSQVIPIEDTIKILGKMSSIIRLPCSCRKYYEGKGERCCLGITIDPIKNSYAEDINREMFDNPDVNNLEYLTYNEAVDLMNGFEKRGLIHTVWTLKSPVVVAICNCNPVSCMGFQLKDDGLRTMFKAEYVAMVNTDACVGCKACIEKCHLGAIYYNSSIKKVIIDPSKCYGCGVCRVPCHRNAITLMNRKDHITAKNHWY